MKNLLRCALLALAALTPHAFPASVAVYEANYPGVKDYNVVVDSAVLEVVPQGNFLEMNLFVSFEYTFESWFFKNYTELELLWTFSLPDEAVVHQFWLVEPDTTKKGHIMDRWRAELIFSDVSSPVRSSGLLTRSTADKNGQVGHELRLFPMTRGAKKRVKIQYLVPGRPSLNALRAWLPTTQLVSSKAQGPDMLRVLYRHPSSTDGQVQIVGTTPDTVTYSAADSTTTALVPLHADGFAEIVCPSLLADSVALTVYQDGSDKFYHLAVLPPVAPRSDRTRKLLIAVDFNRVNTDGLDGTYLMQAVKDAVLQALTPQDSINIIVAYDTVAQGAGSWVPCTPSAIDPLFARVMQSAFPSYSNFQPVVSKAAQLVARSSGQVEVALFTNMSPSDVPQADRDELAAQVLALFKPGTKIHIADLENRSSLTVLYYPWQTTSGYYYYGDYSYEAQLASFYGKLTHASEGSLVFLRYHPLNSLLAALLYEGMGHFDFVETQIRFQGGYAYSRYLLSVNETYYPLGFPVLQIGRYAGDMPAAVSILGKQGSSVVTRDVAVDQSSAKPGTKAVATAWYGNYIRRMVGQGTDPVTINSIVELSMSSEVLTPYTAFLVGEEDTSASQGPGDPGDPGAGVAGGSGNREMRSRGMQVRLLRATGTAEIRLSHAPLQAPLRMQIFDARGRVVRSCTVDGQRESTTCSVLHWDLRDDLGRVVPRGLYVVAVTVGRSRIARPLLVAG